ncbi:MAG TPA: gamma-glutamyl-gamma-aminobutyrate hydrolase family protein [Nocardioides sp.]|uniref:gamma-glutamyl-gamma-aminobutyrate hydrolase family protein n=1 Tax=Nocardioides sp. TaxID=35761 RepID=UPI002CE98A4C|nr:gamma-glutamyl-gamma-aminobutyrate hydrolase family protein [Nocardioides sp.]HQR26092.1 gamma-glutamyl-gamma-aminobutyrate hydrolase family protein [Nocardioides sp.]
MARRPLIAIPSRFSTSASALRHRAEVASRNLVEAVYAGGGEPLLVHPDAPDGTADDAEVSERLWWADGVLLPGGGDLAAHWAGQSDHHTLYDVDEEQDAFDLAVARHALRHRVPLLSICRGTQVVNVVQGGTLVQDMDEHDSELSHHRNHMHHVTVDHGTRASTILGESVEVSCYHHQCIAGLGEGLAVTARSEEGVVEAVEMSGYDGWFLGVQWHPEDTWSSEPKQLAVVAALVEAARR